MYQTTLVEEKQLVGTDINALLLAKKQSKFFSKSQSSSNIGLSLFLAQFFGWITSKLLGVVSILLGQFITLEKSLINLRVDTLQLFYWGRSNVFALFFQAVALFVLLAIGFTYVVGQGIQARILEEYAVEKPIIVYASSADTVEEAGSLITSMPKELKRIDTIEYIVTYDDTIGAKALDNIAVDFEITADSIRWANNFAKNYQPKPGTKIKIPPVSGSQYTVQPNDTVSAIASRYKIDKLTLVEVNFLAGDQEKLKTGQVIFLPGVAPQAPVLTATKKRGSKSYLLYGSGGGSFTAPKGPRFLTWPVSGGGISRCYSAYHDGIDIHPLGSGSSNPNITAAAPGRVTYAGIHCTPGWWGSPCGGYAWVVEIDHGNGFSTIYGHLLPKSLTVGVGDVVVRGQKVARMGNTGTSTGTHVHFQVNHGGFLGKSRLVAVNPAQYLTDTNGCR
ncbi:M23 family metallopeptidase [bacterium]|nr:M23 family metallopeptidase [bacterium]